MEDHQRDLKPFDLGSYFNNGHTVTELDLEPALLKSLRADSFEKKNGMEQAAWSSKSHTDELPEYIQDFARELAQSGYYDWFTKIYGDFTQRTVAVYKWNQNSKIDWRSDASMGAFLSSFIFVGDSLVEGDGASLNVGICDSDPDGNQILNTKIDVATIQGTNGKMVTLYNMNPTVVHEITALENPKELYVVAVYLGYIENTLMKTV